MRDGAGVREGVKEGGIGVEDAGCSVAVREEVTEGTGVNVRVGGLLVFVGVRLAVGLPVAVLVGVGVHVFVDVSVGVTVFVIIGVGVDPVPQGSGPISKAHRSAADNCLLTLLPLGAGEIGILLSFHK